MNIFISWSKKPSMEYALKTKDLLEKIDSNITAFVSERDILAGEDVQNEIINKISECDKLILCFTKENKRSPWLLFEAGYARGLHKTVIPLLFDDDPNWHSWIDNPMNIAKEISINKDSFAENFFRGLDISDTRINRNKLDRYKLEIRQIKDENRVVDIMCEDFVDKLISSNAFTVESPTFHHKIAYFHTGFESYDLYKVITESFMYTGKYLWIYGRKNMKLFGGNFKEFFKYLDDKSYNHEDMDGIDFRCLFLDPNSDEVDRAHSQKEIFRQELKTTLYRARDVIGDNERLSRCFRLYSNKREAIIIRLDNCIIYSRPMFDAEGVPQLLTNTPFEVFSAESNKGKECIQKFEEVWANAQKIHYSF